MELLIGEKEWLMECAPSALPSAEGSSVLRVGKLKFALPSDANVKALFEVRGGDDGEIKLTASGKTLKIEGKTTVLKFELLEPVQEDAGEELEEPAEETLQEPEVLTLVCIDNTGYEDRLTEGKPYAYKKTDTEGLIEVEFDDGSVGKSMRSRFQSPS